MSEQLIESTFKYAGLDIDCATNSKGEIFVSTRTIENTLQYRKNSLREIEASKSFKAFTGESFHVGKFTNKTASISPNQTFYPLASFFKFVYFEVQNKNETALNLVVAGFVTDFEREAREALGIELDNSEYEAKRKLVFERLEAFKGWTNIIHDRHVEKYGKKPEGWYYGKLVKQANLSIFGVADFGSDRTKNMSEGEQRTIRDFESFLKRKANRFPHLDPQQLLDRALIDFS
jgi:hypothetical protein